MPKKLIRTGILPKLEKGEYEVITDKDELNKLYALKLQEELQEILASDCEDPYEFADALRVITDWAAVNGISAVELGAANVLKAERQGTYTNIALNNLNPNNPSNKIYFQCEE
jgi:predicted house-cleaning noncanonical NTP pyrophosphatase (MazG superfamily)